MIGSHKFVKRNQSVSNSRFGKMSIPCSQLNSKAIRDKEEWEVIARIQKLCSYGPATRENTFIVIGVTLFK